VKSVKENTAVNIAFKLSFENLDVWVKSRHLVSDIFQSTRLMSNRSFQDQLQRSCLSIMNNIAEGHESGSPKIFIRYLLIAKGSCGEVRSMLYAASDLKYISQKRFNELHPQTLEISRMISGLVRHLRRRAQ